MQRNKVSHNKTIQETIFREVFLVNIVHSYAATTYEGTKENYGKRQSTGFGR